MTTLSSVAPTNPLFAKLRKITERRATWVLMDQAIVSIGNFLTLRYLLVFLSKAAFGNYGVLWETINYLNSLQAALVIYPLTVRGASEGSKHLKQIATASFVFTILLLPILGGAIIIASLSIHDWMASICAAFALVLWQLQEMYRRALMSDLRFAAAVPGDAISYLGQAVLVAGVGYAHHLNLTTTFLIMAVTSLAAMLVQMGQVGVQWFTVAELKAFVASYWKLGKWMLPNNGASLITALGYWYMLKFVFGPEVAAVFAATTFFFKPANPVQSSMCSLIVPAVARAKKEGGDKAATRQALRYVLFGAALLAPYLAVLAIAPEWCINKASHGRPEYVGIGIYIRLFCINYVCIYTSAVLGAWLAGLGQTRFSFYAQVLNIAATVLIGLPLTYKYGVAGLIGGGLASAGAAMFGTIWFLKFPGKTADAPHGGEVISEPMGTEPNELVTAAPQEA